MGERRGGDGDESVSRENGHVLHADLSPNSPFS